MAITGSCYAPCTYKVGQNCLHISLGLSTINADGNSWFLWKVRGVYFLRDKCSQTHHCGCDATAPPGNTGCCIGAIRRNVRSLGPYLYYSPNIIIIMAEWQLFNVAGYLIEERRRWPIITASSRGQCSK